MPLVFEVVFSIAVILWIYFIGAWRLGGGGVGGGGVLGAVAGLKQQLAVLCHK